MNLRDRGRADRIGLDTGEQRVELLAISRLHRRLDLGEGHGWEAVLQTQQVARRVIADEIGPGRQRLAELDRGGTDRLEGSGIIGLAGFYRANAEEPD